MRRDDKFRFSLQWSADTQERLQAGDLLERLGNKKSDFIVMAVTDYVQRHPDIAVPGSKVKITFQATQTREQTLEMVRSMAKEALEELLADRSIVLATDGQQPDLTSSGPSEKDMDAMLAGLNFFNP